MEKIKKNNLKTLGYNSKIEKGEYAGMKVYDCIQTYGNKGIKAIVRYYNLSAKILKEHHVHFEEHKEKSKTILPTEQVCAVTPTAVVESPCHSVESAKKEEKVVLLPNNNNLWTSPNKVCPLIIPSPVVMKDHYKFPEKSNKLNINIF